MNPSISGFWPQWTVENEIGRGSFGSVYRISRDLFGKRGYSAMKVLRIPRESSDIRNLHAQGMTDASIRTYFLEQRNMLEGEIALMTELKSSANIVSIEDFHAERNSDGFGWTFYIRMELLESLPDYRLRHEMSVREAVTCARDIASALESCENAHIIHRDVKPANIFRNRDGLFKLGDFGIARQLDCSTGARSIIGTPNYEAPEVAFGHAYGHTVDIYSLGLVLFILLNNGQRPFIDPSVENVSYKEMLEANKRRLAGEPLPMPVNADALLAVILEKACAYDALKRYRHAADFREALDHWLFTHPEGYENSSGPEKEQDRTAPHSDSSVPVEPEISGAFVGISLCRAGSSKNYTISASAADSRKLLTNPVTKGHQALTAETFRDFKTSLDRTLGRDLRELVMAVPDGWSRNRKNEVLHIARTAGFSTVRQVSQTAAFAAFYVSGDTSVQNCLSVSYHSDRVDAALYSISGRRIMKQGFASMKNRLKSSFKGTQIAPSLILMAADQAVSTSGLSKDQVQSVVLAGLPDLGEQFRRVFPRAKILSMPEHAGGVGALLASPFMNYFAAPPVDRLAYTLGFSDGTPTGILPVIRRGAPLPAEGTGLLILRSDAHGCVKVRIMEEETADPQNRVMISEHVFSDRTIDPYKSCRLNLTLRADSDGSLDLTVTDSLTGRILRPTNVSLAAHFDPGTSSKK